MKILLLNLFILSSFATEEIWKMGDAFLSFERSETDKSLYSTNCKVKKCQALDALKKVSMKKINSDDLLGGKNPGAVICHKIDKARVVILKDLDGNENSFCLFEDKSMVSSSTLYREAKVNDEKK